jgi:hypothetical protein
VRRTLLSSLLLALPGVLAGTLPAAAGPLPISYIPADAQWVVHVDLEKGLKTSVGSYITGHLAEFEFDGLEAVRAKTGINPLADIKDVTVFGTSGEPQEGVAIIHTTGAVDAFLERSRKEESTFKQVTRGEYTLDTWTEGGSTRFGYVKNLGENERLILVAQDADRLAAAIARTAGPGSGSGPAKAEPGDLLKQPPKATSVLFVAARGLGSMAANPKTVMLQQAEGLVLDCGEDDGFLYASMAVTTRSAQDAQDLLAAMNGCIAIARMGARRNPELAGLMEVTSGLSLSAENGTVRGQMRYESAKALDMLKEAAAKERHKKDGKPAPENAPSNPAPASPEPAAKAPPTRL